ncbi:GvpL/GvpF family gas vesicle protein [Streptomyces sp. NPDC093105]|uniref:GvpL/GvpF family gas vesicle protein n=1 Tax=Streptomyces sp. NPDC093105 TaxID=3366029 RepID=UPI0037FB6696
MTGEPSLTYVYAVAALTPRLDGPLAHLRGVGDAPVTLLSPGTTPSGPAFVVSRVPADQWAEDALRLRFEDLSWLEDTARAHHHVIQVLMEHTSVLPLRLATLYQDSDRALEALLAEQDAFAAQLATLLHQAEYGVKVYVVPEVGSSGSPDEGHGEPASPAAAPPSASPSPSPSPSPGKAYLHARRAQRHAREERYLQAGQAADRIAARAARFATQSVRHPPQTGPLTRRENGENVLNDSYLVPDDQADGFRAALQQVGRDLPGVRIEVTGPWAPYSFATPSDRSAETDFPGTRP